MEEERGTRTGRSQREKERRGERARYETNAREEELGGRGEECLVLCTIWCKILLGNATLLPFAAQAVTDVYPACLTAPPRGIHASVFDSSYLNRAEIIGTFTNPGETCGL